MSKTIDKYVAQEILFPFFMTLFVLTFVLLMGKILQLMDLMINKGVSFFDISKLIMYLLPSFLMITVPIALLIAILIGLGRLSADNEIIVLKSSGISLYRLFVPVAATSVFAFLITAVMGAYFVPFGNFGTRNLLFTIAKQQASIGIKEKVFNDAFKGLVLYADAIPVHGKYMEGVFISDNRISKDPTIIVAQKGFLISNPTSMTVTLRLKNGSTHTVDPSFKSYRKMDFGSYDINLDLSTPMAEGEKELRKKSTEMKLRELMRELKKPGISDKQLREFAMELHKKFAIPFSCLVFGILGLPLGIGQHRSGKSRGFTIGLVVVTIYYVLQLTGDALGENGTVPPVVGTWAPNVILGIIGIYLLIRAAQEKPQEFTFVTRFAHNIRNSIKALFRRT